jgi:alkylation response protein AidB-like acyl-CoA dehydrogenase
MELSLSKEQEMLRKSSREFFKKECPKDKVRELKETTEGYDRKIWKKMVKLGYQGIIIPDQYGGMEGEFIELAVLMEEIGRNIMPSPFFTTMQCALPIMEFGSEDQKEKYLPGIAEKGDIWTLAHAEENSDSSMSDVTLEAKADKDGFLLNGVKLFVEYGSAAKRFLVATRTTENKIAVFIVDSNTDGIKIEIMPTAARDNRCQVTFENVYVPADHMLGTTDNGNAVMDAIMQTSAVLKAAEMYGGACAALDLTLEYTKGRKQFDVSIASFQAVQHRLVNLFSEVEGLQYLVYKAAWAMGNNSPDRILNSAAKTKANSVYYNVCRQGMYLHGAIGWTEEMDIGLYHLRTLAMDFDGGGSNFHKEEIARELEARTPDFKQLYA